MEKIHACIDLSRQEASWILSVLLSTMCIAISFPTGRWLRPQIAKAVVERAGQGEAAPPAAKPADRRGKKSLREFFNSRQGGCLGRQGNATLDECGEHSACPM